MANADKPFGFTVCRTLHGGPPRITPYKCTAAAIYPGDLVHTDGSGRVNSIAATETPMGVAASYVSASADQTVWVYDDLVNTTFEVQVDDATLADDTVIGLFYDPLCTTGDTTTLRSKQELDGDASAEDTLLLLGKINRPDNAWGANVKVEVQVRASEKATVLAVT